MAKEQGISPLDAPPPDDAPDFDSLTVPLSPRKIEDFARDPQEFDLPPELVCDLLPKNGRLSLRMSTVMRIYLQTLVETGRHSAACARAQISQAHALEFRNKYPQFQELVDEALSRFAASVEAEVHRRAIHGVAEPNYQPDGTGGRTQVGVIYKKSDKLLELMLKRYDPAYREAAAGSRTTVNVSAQATATASTTAPGAPPTLDTARMSRAQREAYRAFLATMAPELPEGQPREHAPSDSLPSARPMLDVTPGEPHEAAGASPRHESADRAREAPPAQAPAGKPASDD
jgi:hypothetical protein